MALKVKKFEKMIRGIPVCEQESYEEETINKIKLNELEYLKQIIFVNSLNHIKDDVLRGKCSDITNHYRLFKNDESHYKVKELSVNEKETFEKCIGECVKKEYSNIINEKESIPTDLLQLTESETSMPNTIKIKLNTLLSLLNVYMANKKEINHSIFKLLDNSYSDITEAQHQLAKQVDVVKVNSYKLQSDVISKVSCPEKLSKLLETYLNTKEKEYATNLDQLQNLQKLQNKYEEIDGPQFKALVNRFIQTKEIIKLKTEMLNK